MEDKIQFEPLTSDKLAIVKDFECGTEPWQKEVSNWITGKSDDCAAKALKDRRCKIFLYRTPSDEIVGFGALGKTNGEWPDGDSDRRRVAIIPWMGIYSKFCGKPGVKGEPNYSDRIIIDLIYKAKATNLPLLVLYVHPKNAAAIKVYSRNHFVRSKSIVMKAEEASQPDYIGMWFDLAALEL